MGRLLGTAKTPRQIGIMTDNRCAICEIRIPAIPRTYFCWKCYRQFEGDILAKKAWVKYLTQYELRRRRTNRNLSKLNVSFIYLGDKWDIDENGNLVRRDGYNG